MLSTVVGALLVLWIALSVKEFYVLFYPPACKLRRGCFHARLPLGARGHDAALVPRP